MKILEVSLKNFSRIYSGLGKTHLHIDLRPLSNKIFLFVGENGSGKTSIMRTFHPFAYNSGVGDNTANSDFIIEGKDGEKIITIEHNGNIYEITHIYSRKKDKSISVKSFIKENGIELNDSGTVKTFKDVVLDKLGLDEAFLGLLSLGNTIDGFVKYTASNRKKFATQIFSQLGIYNKYYKIVSSKVRDTKSVLANVTTKLEKYKIYDVDELNTHSIELQAKISSLKKELDNVMVKMGSSQRVILDNENLIREHDDATELFNKILEDIDSLKTKVKTKKDLVTLKNDKDSIKSTMDELKITISGIESSISSELDIKDTKLNTIKTLTENVERMSKNIDMHELTELSATLSSELVEIESAIGNRERPKWSKESLIKVNIYLDELHGMCVDLVNDVMNLDIIPNVLKDFIEDEHIAEVIDLSYQEMKYDYERMKSLTITKSVLDSIRVRPISNNECSNQDCQYVKFYNDVLSIINGNVEDTSQVLRDKKNKMNDVEDMLKAANIIKKLYRFISTNAEHFENLPEELFNQNTFILQYLIDRTIYNTKYLSELIELEELYENKETISQKLTDVENNISNLESSATLHKEMISQIEQLKLSLDDLEKIMGKQKEDLDYNEKKLEELSTIANDIDVQVELLEKLQTLRESMKEVKSKLVSMESRMDSIDEARTTCSECEVQKRSIEKDISETESFLKNTEYTINSITELKKEQRELMEKYSIDKLILESVSPTTGIPLDFINYYIKEEMIGKVNELLDMVYHGKIRLLKSKTVINEDEFTIPYMKRSTVISDISKASDGEKAIISLAFSLVLLNMTSGPYNILLLDEMDTTLDTASRAKYIELLEQFMKTINSEQLFLISHNSMFDVYPVNVLLTSPSSLNMSSAVVLDLTA